VFTPAGGPVVVGGVMALFFAGFVLVGLRGRQSETE